MLETQESKYDARRGTLVNRETGKVIPADEPVFVFRAKDVHALSVLRFYRDQCKSRAQKRIVQERITAFRLFAKEHKDRMGEPD